MTLAGQDFQMYTIYDKSGDATTLSAVAKIAREADVILFGEHHNCPVTHWLQLKLFQSLHDASDGNLALGMEMFEADDQIKIEEYLADQISESSFEKEARIWPNYRTDYKPLVQFAKINNIPVVATNVPRRYASAVYKKGIETLDSLSKDSKRYMAPLPIAFDAELPLYKEMLTMMDGSHGGENFPKAQAIKDATMAHHILKLCKKKYQVLHINGKLHSDNYEGIYWYLNQKRKAPSIVTISISAQDHVGQLDDEAKGVADFIICVPNDMIKTH